DMSLALGPEAPADLLEPGGVGHIAPFSRPQRFEQRLVPGIFLFKPLMGFAGAESEDRHDGDGGEQSGAEHGEEGAVRELVEHGMDPGGNDEARDEPPGAEVEIAGGFAGLALRKLMRDRGEDG